uniref:Uncharacterized protein n=1 Tax=Chromera velia CCMP2878 TaxID=1169474 RepID=A0A0G4HE75_9ALVE|mmetsp:Transcript_52267/g.102325  ORF Transcript_52267/g.102325 Transcript_52267/m.102325 type:complete len:340 (+) Transcript_52267:280-1299(+)|eukprot:Cvel_26537.t1-p1 / transcript=Cvel_26537.t1 / gene=Cvel_26537 / organism=Chromera_velia_CCMP2878 / gene_product=hypothetical protein / transcript_product=hypothetical protein / location=Cvel_scaffold3173:15068-16084(+) / protein_length=339 / sequence_SO=supercontig / SO=protein_coding / is_pseudo=false
MGVSVARLTSGVLAALFLVGGRIAKRGPRVVFGPDATDPEASLAEVKEFFGGDRPSELLSIHFPGDENLRKDLRDELTWLSSSDRTFMERTYFEGVWRSHLQLWEQSGHPAVIRLVRMIEKRLHCVLGQPNWFVHSLWGMVGETGMKGNPHKHPGVAAGVFYVESGDSSEDHGALVWYPGWDPEKEDEEEKRKRKDLAGVAAGNGNGKEKTVQKRRGRRKPKPPNLDGLRVPRENQTVCTNDTPNNKLRTPKEVGEHVQRLTTVPDTGMMLLWKSGLHHSVSAYDSPVPRICIAFNIFEGEPDRDFWVRPEFEFEFLSEESRKDDCESTNTELEVATFR